MVRDSEGWNILFYAYKQRVFPSVIRKKKLVNKIHSFNKTIRMKKKTIQKKSKEVLSIERRIKSLIKVSLESFKRAKTTEAKTFLIGSASSLEVLLEWINEKY